jgi:ABC-2 type transport system permease protein
MRRLALAARQGIQANLIRTLGFFRKELFSVFRQPRLLLTLIVGPFLILLIFGLGYRQTPPPFRTLLVVGSEQAQLVADRQDLNEAFGNAIDLRGTSTDAVAARQQLADGDLDLVILAPEDPTSALQSGERATFTVVHGEVDPVIRANISLVARLSVDEINRRVLADVVDVAQAESEDIEALLVEMESVSSDMVTALEDGDRATAREATGSLRQNLEEAEGATGSSNDLYASVTRSLGGEEDELFSSLEESIAQAESEDPEAALEGATAFEDRVGELRAQIERAQGLEPSVLVSPFAAEVEQINEVSTQPAIFYSPATLVVLLQHLALTFAALSLVRERQLGLTEVFRASPLGSGEALTGKYLGFGSISLVVAGGLTAALLAFGVEMQGSWAMYALVLALLVVASLGLGFVFSGISKTDSQAIQYAMIALLLTIFFTGFVLPLDQLSAPVQVVSYIIPATYGIQALHDIVFRGVAVEPVILAGLFGYALVMAVGAWWVVRRDVDSVG